MAALAPYSLNSWRALEILAQFESDVEAKAFAKDVSMHPYVAHTVKRALRLNVQALSFDRSEHRQ